MNSCRRYNEEYMEVMGQLVDIYQKRNDIFRAKCYQKAQEIFMCISTDIRGPEDIKDIKGIGPAILKKLTEYTETGKIALIERAHADPLTLLTNVYGIGPKKAEELIATGITTIEQLKQQSSTLLNEVQQIGLQYYEDILERIPRNEIEKFEEIFRNMFQTIASKDDRNKLEIVGSYRRGALNSGDIDVIITGSNSSIYTQFVQLLIQRKIIIEVLSSGNSKTLVIGKLNEDSIARRIDFLFTPLNEYAFAILYFTGSKTFNTLMRQEAINQGYTFNEHGIYSLTKGVKGPKIQESFPTEKSIFDFLQLVYVEPFKRVDCRAIIKCNNTAAAAAAAVVKEKTAALETTIVKTGTKRLLKRVKTLKKKEPVILHAEEEIIQIKQVEPFKTLITDFQIKGPSVFDSLLEVRLNSLLEYVNQQYYNKTPVLTDSLFDILKEYIQNRFPNNKETQKVGAPIIEKNKVALPYNMPSMDKIKPDTEALENWKQRFTNEYIVSCKLDGVSGLYTTENNQPKLYTRGDGTIGQDISYFIPYFKLPVNKDITVRGEFIIKKEVFQSKYKDLFANPRNMVAGLINQKGVSPYLKDVSFVAYEVIYPTMTPSLQLVYLQRLNVETVAHQLVTQATLSNSFLSQQLVHYRESHLYEIDGLIVTHNKTYERLSGNPEHAFAFKMVLSEQIAEAKVVDVLWSPSKDGYLKPRVKIEPIHLGGVLIEFATGFNAAFIRDNKIGVGAIIELIRSGDVIPYIKSVKVSAPYIKMPEETYTWNETQVDILLTNKEDNNIVREKNITGFFKGIGVENLSSGNVQRMMRFGFDTVEKILKMSVEDLITLDGFQEKSANKIYSSIQDKVSEASLIQIMSATNIFGRGFNEKKLEIILREYPDVLTEPCDSISKIKKLTRIKGIALKTAELFVSSIENFIQFLKDNKLEHKLQSNIQHINIQVNTGHPFYNKTIVVTGTRDKHVLEKIQNCGAILGTIVNKTTALVVAKTVDEDTKKIEDARKLNIPIVSIVDFMKV
jgi:NAD-dependent DNA ligase